MAELSGAELDTLAEQATVDEPMTSTNSARGSMSCSRSIWRCRSRRTCWGCRDTVKKVDLRPGSGLVAICVRGRHRQAIGVLDLPLPTPRPEGSERIDAYRRWDS